MRSRSFVLSGLIAGAIFFTSSPAFAQVSAGVQGGINIANVSFDDGSDEDLSPNFKSKTRGVFGGFVARDFNAKAGLQIDFLYSQKGTKASFTDGIDTFETDITADYIEIPVLIRANIPGSGNVKARVFGGPAFAFKVTDDSVSKFNGVEVPDEESNDFNTTDVGIVIGGAVQFGKVFVDVRYNWGLVNVIKDPDGNESAKNRVFGIMVGYQFK